MCWKKVKLLLIALVVCTACNGVSSSETEKNVPSSAQTLNGPIWKVDFQYKLLNLTMEEKRLVQFTVTEVDTAWGDDFELHVLTSDSSLLTISNVNYTKNASIGPRAWSGNFTVEAVFLGRAKVQIELQSKTLAPERSAESLHVIITRNEDIWDKVFVGVIGAFIMLLYVNFGAALELDALKDILLKPIGPAIGIVGQFVVMPLTSFVIGYFLFRDMVELRLGLFFTGSTPGGGLSNIFTVILNGNLNLSITMTAISNLAAFAMMPLWMFTLGTVIFKDGDIPVPYTNIAIMSFSLVIPLTVGIAIQKFSPKAADVLVRMLKPISIVLVLVITILMFFNNSYMFQLLSWRIIIGASALPWCGYLIGYSLGMLFRQGTRDSLTIAIETGIQNTGIAVFMLLVTLPQPQADITTIVPITSYLMTPLPLLAMYIFKRTFCRDGENDVPDLSTIAAEIEQIGSRRQSTRPATFH